MSEPSLPSEHPFGFDPDEAADQAMGFVRAVNESGWFRPPDGLPEWFQAGGSPWAAVGILAGPLAAWERAMNPARLGFSEFDRMDRLRQLTSDPDRSPAANDQVFAAQTLAAGLGWVVRLLHAEDLWGGGRWEPRPPFGHLPEGLIDLICRAAAGLRARTGVPLGGDAGRPPPGPVSLADAAREASGLVFEVVRIGMNLDGRDGHPSRWDEELFHLLDRLEWHYDRLPKRGYEPCYPDRAWDDAGVSGTCAHAAALDLRHRVFSALGGAAWQVRAGASEGRWAALPWPVPFWLPEARPLAAARLPRPDMARWDAQLEIERTRLAAALSGPTDRVVCKPADRSVWLDGREIASRLPAHVFEFVRLIHQSDPDPIPFSRMKRSTRLFNGKDQTRDLKNKLTGRLAEIIDSGKRGYSFRLPPPKS